MAASGYSLRRKSLWTDSPVSVIFDKSLKGYKEKDAEANAWDKIANSLDFIPDGMYYILATN